MLSNDETGLRCNPTPTTTSRVGGWRRPAGGKNATFPITDRERLKLLETLIDKQVMSKEEMAATLAAKTDTRFNSFLRKAKEKGQDVTTFFPVGEKLRLTQRKFDILKRVYNENWSRDRR